MLGTVVLLHHDIAVVVDPDVLMRRAVQQSLADLGLQALAYGGWHDAVRQLARVAPKLRSLPLPSDQADWDAIELWQRLQHEFGSSTRGLSVLPVVGLSRRQPAVMAKPHPSQLLARQLRDYFYQRRQRAALPVEEKPSVSPAEGRVLDLVKDGCSNKRIASELSLSQRTVESHLHRLFRKLQVRNRTELALLAT